MTLLRRILRDHLAAIVALGVAMVANIGVYMLLVRPLELRSAGAEDRAVAAAAALRTAAADLTAARAAADSQARANTQLAAFYSTVVPADLSAARRMTYASLPALARRTNVRYEERRIEVKPSLGTKDQRLGHLGIRMALQGSYEAIRQFIYELESAPSFVIIDEVVLAQSEPDKPLELSVELSTYYRLDSHAR